MFRLKEVRKEHKKSQEELAKLLGVTQAALSGWENEKYEIDNKSLIKCAEILNVSVDYLLGLTDKPRIATVPSTSAPLHCPTENTIHIVRRTGFQKKYTLSDVQTDLIEGMLEQLCPSTNEPVSGTIAAVTGEINKAGKKKKPTIL